MSVVSAAICSADRAMPGISAGDADAGVHQRLVLGFIAGVAGEETAAGKLRDLFVDQALFVETVTEALLGGGDRETIDYDPFGADSGETGANDNDGG